MKLGDSLEGDYVTVAQLLNQCAGYFKIKEKKTLFLKLFGRFLSQMELNEGVDL